MKLTSTSLQNQHDGEHLLALQEAVGTFLKRSTSLLAVRAMRNQLPSFDRNVWTAMAEQGWLSVLIPEDRGGLGLGLAEMAVLAETLARGVLPEPFVATAVLGASILARCPSSDLASTLLTALAEGTTIAAPAWQETPDRFDPLDVATTARKGSGGCLLNGVKDFIPAGDGADGFIVSAKSPDGSLGLYWVSKDAGGVSLTHDFLIDGTSSTSLSLKDAVGQKLAEGPDVKDILQDSFDAALIISGAELLGLARAGFDLTLSYIATRVQFGKPIGSFQALQHRAVDCYVQIELANAVLNDALQSTGSNRSALASRVKARCAYAAELIARESIQMHGALGFTDESNVGLYVKRVLAKLSWLGGAKYHRRRFEKLVPAQEDTRPQRNPKRCSEQLRNLPDDTDWNALADDDFRGLVRDFIENEYPDNLRYLPRRVNWHEVRDWNLKLSRRGWIAPGWPREWGGMALLPAKQLIFLDELERWGVGRAPDQGVRQLGPVLMKYGSDAQKREYLPKVVSCDHVWCQGYSEPNAGSDLANVGTTAELDGNEFVINGSKIWTSMAMDSTHIYVLCRTDKSVKKQAGISFIIADLTTKGITIRPIVDIAGNVEFCEIFFDNVRVPKDNLIGGLNNGWTVAKAVLEFERLGIGSPRRPAIALNRMIYIGRKLNLQNDRGYCDQLTEQRLNLLDNASLFARFSAAASAGTLGPEVSILKIWGMEVFQRITEATLEWAGSYGAKRGAVESGEDDTNLYTPYFMSRMITIGGGSNEILRNLLSKQILELPG
jgi:3-oxochol-4-en-24-oyl-CoA dehydrogenase